MQTIDDGGHRCCSTAEYTICPNDALISDILLRHASDLVEGKAPLSRVGFLSLCSVVESVILHDSVIGSYTFTGGALAEHLESSNIYVQACNRISGNEMLTKIRSASARELGENAVLMAAERKPNDVLDIFAELVIPDLIEDRFEKGTGDSLVTTLELFDEYCHACAEAEITLGIPAYTSLPELPFRLFYTRRSLPSRGLYDQLRSHLKMEIGEQIISFGIKHMFIPPFVAILLDQCDKREDIPDKLIELRAEFEGLRKARADFLCRMHKAKSIGEERELWQEHEKAWNKLLGKIEPKEEILILKVWDIVKSGSPTKIISEAADRVLRGLHGKKELGKLDSRFRINQYANLYARCIRIAGYDGLVAKVFGGEFDPSDVNRVDSFSHGISKMLDTFPRQEIL